ncbi:MAG: hypothetical protein HY820_20940 [Acidobacteria bacterium]|nr:hypothetical protein [Acidobacteriota bacterium]
MTFPFSVSLLCFLGVLLPITAPGQTPARSSTNRHVGFDTPEAWAMKYFTSVSLMSGLQPPPSTLEVPHKVGSLTAGLEMSWLPELSTERATVGFSGRKEEDLNKVPVFIRPSLRVGIPWKFSVVVAGLPPARIYGVTPGLFAFGLERPVIERPGWRLGWRGYGQVGSVGGAFTCPKRSLGFPAGSPQNPSGCIGESSDTATLRYAGTEAQFSIAVPRMPRLIPHAAAGINLIDSAFQIDAPTVNRVDNNGSGLAASPSPAPPASATGSPSEWRLLLMPSTAPSRSAAMPPVPRKSTVCSMSERLSRTRSAEAARIPPHGVNPLELAPCCEYPKHSSKEMF